MKADDLVSLLAKLRKILLKKSVNDDVDSKILRCIESIKSKINELSNQSNPTEVFDLVQKSMEIYIRDLLSMNQCSTILCNKSFQEIFVELVRIEKSTNLSSIYENNAAYAQTVFNCSFELLSLPVIQDFFNDKYLKELFSHLAFIADNILDRIEESIDAITFKKNDLENRIENLRILIEYADRNKSNTDQTQIADITDNIIAIFWDLADRTMLVPTIIKSTCAPYFVKWISLTDTSMDMQTQCLHILHNLARHDQGVEALNNAGCISVLKEFKHRILDPNRNNEEEPYVELRLLYCMVYSLLTEPKEDRQDLKDLHKVLKQLMRLVVDAGQSDTKTSDGFHVSEPLAVLTKLCLNDEILHYIVKECSVKTMRTKSIIEFLCELMLKFRGALASENNLDQFTLLTLFNMIWSISFHDEYTTELKANSKFLITVKSLANDDGEAWVDQYVPKYMSSIPKAAKGILWNLDEDNPARANRTITTTMLTPTTTATVPDKGKRSMGNKEKNNRMRVMVSYSHADNDFCRQLVDALQKDNRFEIWVDFAYCHTEDLWEEIGEAIEKADIVLFLMSKDYQDSKSCRQEVMYTKDSLKKRFIPIYIKKDFVATGWLGVRIVGPQYIRFGKKSFEETVKELIKIIADDTKQSGSQKSKSPPPTTEKKPIENTDNPPKPVEETQPIEPELKSSPKQPVETWTKKEIAQWLCANQIQQELIELYDFQSGTDLLLYGQCLRPNWQVEYADMRTRYEQKYNTTLYRDQFVRLVGAINSLQPSRVTSKACIIS